MVSNKLCLEGTFSPPDLLSANSYIIETRSCDKEQICKAICSWIEFSVSHAFAKRVKLLEEKGGKEKGKTVFIQHTGNAVPLKFLDDNNWDDSLLGTGIRKSFTPIQFYHPSQGNPTRLTHGGLFTCDASDLER
eukprot:GHVR01044886.1.p2 GENE.GHVR01044886.1~~GHVR01044886.1.p2  ORF type:complete len:134 (-),score=6.07 GHVR01044886.1:610-1011(-)